MRIRLQIARSGYVHICKNGNAMQRRRRHHQVTGSDQADAFELVCSASLTGEQLEERQGSAYTAKNLKPNH